MRILEAISMKTEENIMEICKAVPQDPALIKHIMPVSKAYWGYSDDFMNLWEEQLSISPTFFSENEVYLAKEHAQSVGFHALKPPEQGVCELVGLWIIPQRIGTGIGRLLFTHALNLARILGANEMRWGADPHAMEFYHHMGAHHILDINNPAQ